MRSRVNAAFLSLMIAAAIHRREGDPHQPRRILIDADDNEDNLEQHVTDLSPPFPTSAEVHNILQIPPAPSCINDGRPPLSPVRLVDGRWVNADETTPERRYTADDEHPGECWGKVRDFPCLPLPEEPTPPPKD